jgi:hypothetical protein
MSSYNTALGSARDSDSEDEHPELGPPISPSGQGKSHQLPPIDTTKLTASPEARPVDSPEDTTIHDHHELQMNWETPGEKALSETQKLQVIIEEFGEVSTIMENADGTDGPSERILAESHGSLYR